MDMTVISSDELDRTLEINSGKLMVLFIANWCGYCRALRRELDTVSLAFRIIGVDISSEEDRAWDDYRIDVVPTALLFMGREEIGRRAASFDGLRAAEISSLYESGA
jgi:thiol-disulfide isomerase/thioredoxin